MKYIKVKIIKERTNKWTFFTYPEKYDSAKFKVISYENKWNWIEHCIASTDNTFVESDWLQELNIWQAKQFIKQFIEEDKDINDEKLKENWKSRADFILQRQNSLWK